MKASVDRALDVAKRRRFWLRTRLEEAMPARFEVRTLHTTHALRFARCADREQRTLPFQTGFGSYAAALVVRVGSEHAPVQSDLDCPDPMNDEVRIYGYTLTLDAITGEGLDAIPGSGCIVC